MYGVTTLLLGIRTSNPDGIGLGKYEFISWDETVEARNLIASGLVKIFVTWNDSAIQKHVGLYSINRPEWIICDRPPMLNP